jgi:hypothetical protein
LLVLADESTPTTMTVGDGSGRRESVTGKWISRVCPPGRVAAAPGWRTGTWAVLAEERSHPSSVGDTSTSSLFGLPQRRYAYVSTAK